MSTPLVFRMARTEMDEVLLGFEEGAFDYAAKSFSSVCTFYLTR